jgi:uncharacterized protein (DUF1499 family)
MSIIYRLGKIVLSVVFLSACSSTTAPALIDGKLKPCPNRPNCVSSETSQPEAKVAPLKYQSSSKIAWQHLKQIVSGMGGEIKSHQGNYLWATFTSRIFRFVDDVEFRLVGAENVIHVRSASRVGYSDLGVNRKRVERLRTKFSEVNS